MIPVPSGVRVCQIELRLTHVRRGLAGASHLDLPSALVEQF